MATTKSGPAAPATTDAHRDEATALIALLDALASGVDRFGPHLSLHDRGDGLVSHVLRLWCSVRDLRINEVTLSSEDLGTWLALCVSIGGVEVTVHHLPRVAEPEPDAHPNVIPLSNADERRVLSGAEAVHVGGEWSAAQHARRRL